MKKNRLTRAVGVVIMLIVAGVFLSVPALAFEEIPSVGDNLTAVGGAARYAEVGESPFVAFAQVVGQVIGILLALLGVIFLGLMVYAGWMWLMAGGNEEHVTKAKALIRQAVVGIVIVVAAYALTYFVLEQLAPFNENLQGFQQ